MTSLIKLWMRDGLRGMDCRVCIFSLKSNSFCPWLLMNFLYKHWACKAHALKSMFCGRAETDATDQWSALMLYLNSTWPGPAGQRLPSASAQFWDAGCWCSYASFIEVTKREKAHGHLHGTVLSWLHFWANWWRDGSLMPPHRCNTVCKVGSCQSLWSGKVFPSFSTQQWRSGAVDSEGQLSEFQTSLSQLCHSAFLKGDCLSDGVFATIQLSAQQCQPPKCLRARGILAKGTIDLTQERISCIFKAASHCSCPKPFV